MVNGDEEPQEFESVKDTQRLDYMDDPMCAENITTGSNDDGEWGYIRHEEGLELWYPTLRKAIDCAVEYERMRAES